MSENTKKPLQNLECIAKDFKTKGYCLLVTITNLTMFLLIFVRHKTFNKQLHWHDQ
jgi:hypothetical protein